MDFGLYLIKNMNNKAKVFFTFFNAFILYIILDYNDDSFFNLNSLEFYIKLFAVIIFGIISVTTIKGGKKSS